MSVLVVLTVMVPRMVLVMGMLLWMTTRWIAVVTVFISVSAAAIRNHQGRREWG